MSNEQKFTIPETFQPFYYKHLICFCESNSFVKYPLFSQCSSGAERGQLTPPPPPLVKEEKGTDDENGGNQRIRKEKGRKKAKE